MSEVKVNVYKTELLIKPNMKELTIHKSYNFVECIALALKYNVSQKLRLFHIDYHVNAAFAKFHANSIID